MILQKEIRDVAMQKGVPKTTIDKDWVLGHVLYGLFTDEVLGKQLIFKGGTCLRKCYFEDYRFSEDLDFTLVAADFEISLSKIEVVFSEIHKRSGILFHIESLSEMIFENQRVGFKVLINYWGADHPKNQMIPDHSRWHSYIKLEFITHELMCFDIIEKKLLHKYSDIDNLNVGIPCYNLDEVICEKLRAILQRKYTAPRDYYDLWYLLFIEKYEPDWIQITLRFKEKAKFKNVLYNNATDFFSEKNLKTLRSHWKSSLGHHIEKNKLPDVEVIINDLKDLVTSKVIL
ncbi:MAG TPA: nucleotidyl transferase AbiEii/AbiGii toxin family protein [Saprospiraceae bacterium]|nr:nucleotidyl transferase AbiEii/AbiGii toxin family protein [Saprospiraceae bacterium]HPN69886.1 nucleotidyl transferase AbiEii/AbiGii toxin family protein [Saprospiraceae bacterium]